VNRFTSFDINYNNATIAVILTHSLTRVS